MAGPYPVIYAFGDSLSDAGDAYLLTNSSVASTFGLTSEPVSPPYFQAVYAKQGGGTLTANLFTNGAVWVQDLAVSLGIPIPGPGNVGFSSPFGYQSVAGGAANGTDFAIGGSVTGPSAENSGAQVPVTDLTAQITNFKQSIPAPDNAGLYTVWSGSNDLLNLVSDSNFATLSANGTAATDVTTSVNNEIAAIQTLVAGGAQTVLVLNVPDLGKVPAVTAKGTAAATAAGQLAASFDSQLATDIMTGSFGAAHVVLEDTYSLIDNAIASPGTFGLTNVTGSVYTGSFTSDNPPPTVTGAAQNQYLFFDGLHPTSTGHMALAQQALTLLSPACYCPGSLIRTETGETAVEELQIGDRLVTKSGAVRAVKWIGRRSYDGRFIEGRPDVLPVCVRAGALGDGTPRRDLWVSPRHAMFLDGVLVPAACLVNGASITQGDAVETVHYVHVELDEHDVIWAEGAASETFVDDNSRGMFHNAHEYAALYPGRVRVSAVYCAPRVEDGETLAAIRRKIDERAGLAVAGAGDRLRGSVDSWSDGMVCGWAQNPDKPEAPVCLDVYLDGVRAARTLANEFRPDLLAAGLGSGCHSFRVKLPVGRGRRVEVRRVEVRRVLDGMVLGEVAARRVQAA